jgi:OOP family OmpA-OmpF porin
MSPTKQVKAWNDDMKKRSAFRLLGLAGLGCLAAAPALAQDSYYYGGLSAGASRARIDEERITGGLLSRGLTTSGFDKDESGVAFRLFGGYQFNRYFAVEGGYFNLGKFGFTSTTVGAGTLAGEMKVQGLNIDVVGTLPITERFAALGRVGATYARTRDNFTGTGAIGVADPSPSKSGAGFKLGVGLQYAFTPAFMVRGEAERYRIDDAVGNKGDVNAFMLSLVFPFGRSSAPAPREVATPAYVPPPAPPAAVIAPPPQPLAAAPSPQRVSFSADSLFGFDQSVVRPEGKAALDNFARQLSGSRYDVVTVEGHTDRLGAAAYNERLSLKRAETVRTYLVTSGSLDPSRVKATGKGSAEPVTKPDDCRGSNRSAKLIACLQPDRRVEVEVSATR